MSTALPANDNRPAEFDAAIVAYLPGLHALAKRLRPTASQDVHDELVQDTVCKAFASWRHYRPGSTPLPWLKFLMRAINRDALVDLKKEVACKTIMGRAPFQATLPNQEHAAAASLLLGQIAPALRAEFVEIGMGTPCAQLAVARGVTKQRMDQIVRAERDRLAAMERRADTRRALAA